MKRTKAAILAICLCLALTAVGCGNRASEKQTASDKAAVPNLESSENIEDKDSAAPVSKTITLAFAGDINLDDSWCVMQHMKETGENFDEAIDSAFQEDFREADLAWINNEFTYSKRGTPLPGKAYTFRADPANVTYLQKMGIDIAGLANNHVYDYGPDALCDTLDTLKDAGIATVGAGRNLAEAKAPLYMQAGDLTIAYVAASRAEKNRMTPQATETDPGILRCYDMTEFLSSVREAAAHADYVIALPHWGTEYARDHDLYQTEWAKELIEAGADAVIGAHTHCLQGVEFIEGAPVFYSLGNFWFNEKTLFTMIAEIELTYETSDSGKKIKDAVVRILPGIQDDYCTRKAIDPDEKALILKDIHSLSPYVDISADGVVTAR